MTDPATTLEESARAFADDLHRTITGSVRSNIEPFTVVASSDSAGNRASILSMPREGIALTPDRGQGPSADEELPPAFTVNLSYACHLSPEGFLTVDNSAFVIGAYGFDQPLFRLDYLRDPRSGIPAAHYNIHAHRDEFVYAMLQGESNRRQRKRRSGLDAKGAYPRISQLHFPVGGPRFRPCLEDMIQMVIEEFGVQTEEGWRAVLEDGRTRWRTAQLRALVWKNPDLAAEVLTDRGYSVDRPLDASTGVPVTFRPDERLGRY